MMGTKKIEKAVIRFEGDTPVAKILPQKNCSSGSGCHGCGACGSTPADQDYEVPLLSAAGYKTGDMVTVEIDGPGEIAGGLVMFMLPLALVITGGILGNLSSGDGGMVLGGVVGFVAGFALVWLLGKTLLRSSARIVQADETDNSSSSDCCHF